MEQPKERGTWGGGGGRLTDKHVNRADPIDFRAQLAAQHAPWRKGKENHNYMPLRQPPRTTLVTMSTSSPPDARDCRLNPLKKKREKKSAG